LIQFGAIAGSVRPPRLEPQLPPLNVPTVPALRAVRPTRELLHIGYQRYGLLPVLKATGALERALQPLGVQVEWREQAGGMQLFDALRAAEIELGMVGETPPVFAQAERVPFVYLGAEAPAPRREAIVVQARSPIRSVRDLTGCTVMLNHGSNAHYCLILALQEAGLEYGDIRVVHEAPDHALKLFEGGLIDAWATWDPFLEAARRRAGARVLRDADGLTDNTAYYVAARTLVDERPELVQVFMQEINSAARWARESGSAALELVASQLGNPSSTTPDTYAHNTGVRLLDATHVASQQEIANTFLRLRLIERPVHVAEAQRFPRQIDLQAAQH
jgi:sulfonate transport system substrate-binding protein